MWKRSDLLLVVGGIAVLGGSRPMIATAKQLEAAPVVIVIDDRAGVLPLTLDRAVKEATRIYRQAGLKTEWVKAATSRHPSALTIELIIQAKLRAERAKPTQFLLGAAPPTLRACGGTVYLFHEQISGLANVRRLDSGLVLGTVIAHEIGHVLLRERGHSAEGLMRAPWGPHEWERSALGLLLFSEADLKIIRSTISSCLQETVHP